jgi:hypothetical protein
MAKSAPELKCRFASNSMPQSYGRGKKPGRSNWSYYPYGGPLF